MGVNETTICPQILVGPQCVAKDSGGKREHGTDVSALVVGQIGNVSP